MMDQVRFGIIGLHNHYHAYPMADYLKRGIPNASLVAVADERADYAEKFAQQYGAQAAYKDYRELLDRKDIDAVIITSYTSAHAEQVEASAASGRHILLDKPIATSLADANRIAAATEKYQVKLLMAYLLRYLPAYQKAKQLVDEGVIGKLTSAFYSIRIPATFIKDAPGVDYRGWYADPAKGGGGGFIDHGVHFTDWFRWFFESDAVSANGRTATLKYTDLPVEDYGIATYQLESGAVVTVESTWHTAEWYGPMASPDRCTLTGTDGEIEFHYQKSPQIEVASIHEPYTGRVYFDWIGEERSEICYRNMLVDFVDCLLNDRDPVPNAVDGLKALEMILAAYESDRCNQTVQIPLKG
jgi:predicted dehydrogenase